MPDVCLLPLLLPTIALNELPYAAAREDAGGLSSDSRLRNPRWIAIGVTIGHLKVETSIVPFLLAAGASLVMSLFSLTLPIHLRQARSVDYGPQGAWTGCARDAETILLSWCLP